MAFFDDFGKKISNLGQTAVQKTKGVTDAARLNGTIYDEERNLNNCYREIGRIYVQIHSNDPEPSLTEYVRAAVEAERRLSAYRQQAQEARGMIQCPACGGMVTANSAFCNICGFKLQNTPMNPRPNGMPTPPINFQPNGIPTPPINPRPNGMPTPPINPRPNGIPTPPINPQPNGMPTPPLNTQNINCPKCGASVNGNLNFCTMCGTKLDKSADVSAAEMSNGKSPFARPDTPNKDVTPSDIIREKADNSEEKKTDIVKCERCGTDMNSDLNFCTVCGAKLEKEAPKKPKLSLEKKSNKDVKKSPDTPPKNSDKPIELPLPPMSQEKPSDTSQVPPLPPMSQEKPSDTSQVPPLPPMPQDKPPVPIVLQEKQSDNPPQKSKGFFVKKPKNPPTEQKPQMSPIDEKIPVTQDKPLDKPLVPQEKPSVPPKTDDKPSQKNDDFKTAFALSETALEFLNKKPDLPANDNKPETVNPSEQEIKCPGCGANVKRGVKFCVVCGTKMPTAEDKPPVAPIPRSIPEENKSLDVGEIKCSSCGSVMGQGVKFCTVCGSMLAGTPNLSELPKSDVPPIIPSSPMVGNMPSDNVNSTPFSKKKCGKCGAVFDSDMRFCTSCGSPLENTPNNSNTPPLPNLDGGTIYAVSAESFEEYNMPTTVLSENTSSDDDYSKPLYDMPTVVLPNSPFGGEEESAPTINLDGQMCPNCKSVMASDMLFCTECGTRLP